MGSVDGQYARDDDRAVRVRLFWPRVVLPGRAGVVWNRAADLGLSGMLTVIAGMAVSWSVRAVFGLAGYPVEVCLGVVVLLGLCVAPMVRSARTGAFDLFELAVGFAGIYFLYFGLRALVLLVDPGILVGKTPHPSVIVAALPQAIWYANLGMAAYLAGYRVSPRLPLFRERLFRAAEGVDARLLVQAAIVIYVLGWLARLPELLRGWFVTVAASRFAADIPPSMQSVSYFTLLGIFGYTLSLVALCVPGGDRPLPRVAAAVFTPLEFLYAFLIGSKFHLGLVISILFIVRHYLYRRISPRSVLLTILIFIFVVTPVITVYRGIAAVEDIPLRNFGSQLPRVGAQTIAGLRAFTPERYVEGSVRAFTDRLSGIDGLAVTLRGVPLVVDYVHGATLIWVVKILVPTILEPGKNAPLAQLLAPVPRLFGFPDARNGGIAITSVAEFYWNFGTPGVLLGMWIVGALQGGITVLLLRPPSPLGVFVYAVTWAWMMTGVEGWAYAVYGNALRLGGLAVLISFAILWVARWRHAPVARVERAAS